jgi:hypothetical protein
VTLVPKLEDHYVHILGPSPTGAHIEAQVPVSGAGHSSYLVDEQSPSTLAEIVVGRIPESNTAYHRG